jgi:hypothetical protein
MLCSSRQSLLGKATTVPLQVDRTETDVDATENNSFARIALQSPDNKKKELPYGRIPIGIRSCSANFPLSNVERVERRGMKDYQTVDNRT